MLGFAFYNIWRSFRFYRDWKAARTSIRPERESDSAPRYVDWSQCSKLESLPGKVSGAWVFRGTRVPVSAVLRNLESLSVAEVSAQFPSVSKDQVCAVLDFLADSAEVRIAS